jgi:hypothetical protein
VGVVVIIRRDFIAFALRVVGWSHVRVGTSDTASDLKYANLFLQLLDVRYCLLKDLEFKLFFLPLLSRRLPLRCRSQYVVVVIVIVVRTVVIGGRELLSSVCRYEISQHC